MRCITRNNQPHPVTIKDVAKRASVAVGTVSRYLNGLNLREDKRLRVQKAIIELDYKENIMARGLKSKRSMTIGALVPTLTEVFSTSIITSLEKIVEAENYSVILSSYEGNNEKLVQKLIFLKERFVDALILFPLFTNDNVTSILKEYLEEKIPIVIINEEVEGINTDQVKVDNFNASFRAVENLIHNNHKRIAIINGFEEDYVGSERLKGYYEALQTYGVPIDKTLIKYGMYSIAGGKAALRELMSQDNPPTAVYITNYLMTYGALLEVYEMDIIIPDQLSIISFDRTEVTDINKPPIMVIEQPTDKMGELAADLILRRIKGDYSDFPRTHQINTKMLIRDSVKKL